VTLRDFVMKLAMLVMLCECILKYISDVTWLYFETYQWCYV